MNKTTIAALVFAPALLMTSCTTVETTDYGSDYSTTTLYTSSPTYYADDYYTSYGLAGINYNYGFGNYYNRGWYARPWYGGGWSGRGWQGARWHGGFRR